MGGVPSIPLNFVCGNQTKQKINNIENDIQNIKENHLVHIERDIAIINNNIAEMRTNIQILINR